MPKVDNKQMRLITEDALSEEISELLLFTVQESILTETNTILESKLSIMTISEEIEQIKQSLSKMSPNISGLKTCPTQESVCYRSGQEQTLKDDLSFLNDNGDESIIQKKNTKYEEGNNQMSFISSFLN